jgi:hypothetical protein
MGILLHRFWLPHHDTAPREKKDVVALALTLQPMCWCGQKVNCTVPFDSNFPNIQIVICLSTLK